MQTRSDNVDRPHTAFRRVGTLLALAAAPGVFALVALAALAGAADRSPPVSAAVGGPEMALDVIGGGTCAGGVCQVGLGSNFALAVNVVTGPPAGYIGMQTFIDFGVYDPAASEDGAGPNSCSDSIDNGGGDEADRFDADCVTVDLVYTPAAQASDEITWPDLSPETVIQDEPGPGLLFLSGLTSITPPFANSTFEGSVTSVQMTCPASPIQATINLLPIDDPIALTDGSGFVEPDLTIVVPKVGSLTIDCLVLPTPTPTATPTDTPTPSPTATPTPIPVDTDGDGCTDDRENSLDETLGGRRDYQNPWDFYDTNNDKIIDLFSDILGVILHYSLDGSPPYDANFDRGPTTGPNPWNMTAPDGVTNLFTDILGVIQQYGHDCR